MTADKVKIKMKLSRNPNTRKYSKSKGLISAAISFFFPLCGETGSIGYRITNV
jgi:hypothetical protein